MKADASKAKLAAQYLRMSTEMQIFSTSNQRVAIAAYAKQRGFRIVKTYSDDGKSGVRIANRPGLQSLLEDIKDPKVSFGRVLVYDVSRWGRFLDVDESAHYEYIVRNAGIAVDYCTEQFENDGSLTSSVMKVVRRVGAADFSRMLSKNVRLGQQQAVLRGYRPVGAPGYGLRRMLVDEHGRHLEVMERGSWSRLSNQRTILVPGPAEEVEVVQTIFIEYLGGADMANIAATLNRCAVPNVSGRAWSIHNVAAILFNDKYIGTSSYGMTSDSFGEFRKEPQSNWTKVPDAFEAIVSKELFAQAQTERARRQHTPSHEERLFKLQAHIESGKLMNWRIACAVAGRGGQSFLINLGGMDALYALFPRRTGRDITYITNRSLARDMLSSVASEVRSVLLHDGVRSDRVDGMLCVDGIPRVFVVVAPRSNAVRERLAWTIAAGSLERPGNVGVIALLNEAGDDIWRYLILPRRHFKRFSKYVHAVHLRKLSNYVFENLSQLSAVLVRNMRGKPRSTVASRVSPANKFK